MEPSDEIERLRRLNRDLISLLALPAMWPVAVRRGPTGIVELLLDVLVSMLRLDFVQVRLMDPLLDMVRGEATEAMLCRASFNLGPGGGILVAASHRSDFPTEDERLLLRVAANQFITGLETAHYLTLERYRSEQLRKLAKLSVELSSIDSADRMIQQIIEAARDIIGACKVRIDMSADPVVSEDNRPVRTPQHVSAQLVDRDGRIIGCIQLEDKMDGDFTEEDEAILVQLAHQASAAIVNARLYDQLRESHRAMHDANRKKDEFMAVLGHELRNPLAPILTAVQLMELRGAIQSTEREIIERQVRHLVRLVDDLLDVSRIARGKVVLNKQPLEVAEIIARAVEMASPLFEQRSHQLSISVPRSGLPVMADPDRLAQVFSNLLTNAAKYTEPGGRISVTAERRDSDIQVSVEDNGMGIAPDLLPRIFDSFVQSERTIDRAQGGLGLGLSLVESLISLHSGRVQAFSEGIGLGSRFLVTLPALDDFSPVAGRAAFSRERRGAPGARVLIVDDNVDAAELMAKALAAIGYCVETAHDGPAAIRAAAQMPPDVAFLDIGLPVMDGYELAQRLREQPRTNLRLIAMTGYGQDHDRKRAADSGFDAYLVKPVDIEAMAEQVRQHLRAKS